MNQSTTPQHHASAVNRYACIILCILCSPFTSAQISGLPDLECVITPSSIADVSSAVPGVLVSVPVERSAVVQAGQVVARLDSGVEKAELELASARAEIYSEIRLNEVNLAYDKRNRGRFHSLHKGQAVSAQDRERAERNVELSQWKVHQAKDINRLRQLELNRTQEVLKRKSVTSPLNGVVVQRYRSAGEYIEDQPILRIVQLDPLYVEAAVPMEFFGQVTQGMDAKIVPGLASLSPYTAHVTVVDRMGDAESGTFGIRLELPNPDYAIPAGHKCKLSFRVDNSYVDARAVKKIQ